MLTIRKTTLRNASLEPFLLKMPMEENLDLEVPRKLSLPKVSWLRYGSWPLPQLSLEFARVGFPDL